MRFLPILLIFMGLITINLAWAADDEQDGTEEEKAPTTMGYFEMKPSLVVNLQGGRRKYMRCDVQLMTQDDTNIEEISTHAPALRHELLMLFGDQESGTLKTIKGKEALRKSALKALQKIMEKLSGEKRIDDLFFTAFYVQ